MNDFGSHKKASWRSSLESLAGVIGGVEAHHALLKKTNIVEALDRVVDGLERDLESLSLDAAFLFSTQTESETLTETNVEILRRWHLMGQVPSLSALCIFAMENLNVSQPNDLIHAVLLSSVLGEVPNDLTYHNNMHYRKVLLQAIRLIVVHNEIYEGTSRAFDNVQIALVLIAACVHDLGHDGLGNTLKGVFEQGRLEKQSFELIDLYLGKLGLDEEKREALRVMILCTEVTPLDDPANPMNQMKAAYRFHYMGDKAKTHTLNLEDDLSALQNDPELTMMSLILHEADIATSAGLNYKVTKFETSIYMREIDKKHACAQHVVDFLNQICQRKMLSDAGQRLYAANLARIYALAQEDIKNGEQLFPEPDHSDFLVSFGAGDKSGTSKTIN